MFIKYIFRTVLTLFLVLVSYISLSFILLLFTDKHTHINQNKEIYIYADVAHTEIMMKVKYFKKEFSQKFPNLLKNSHSGYITFSFGDRDFFMQVLDWSDLEVGVALKSLFINTPALIRVSHFQNINKKNSKKIEISDKNLQTLKNSILDTFSQKDGKFRQYIDHFKENHTNYFHSKQQYNIFNTCNSWTGDRLRDAKITQPYITPFAQQVIYPF